ncbi:hypothetical protein ZWY2020_033321 [Hordeum vulgare]|nr:hypothetical protein ZWY2020_033321 [Hordeum vulgare]
MEDGRHRRKSAQRETAPATKIDAIPDHLVELVFLCLPLHHHLVYAAWTCRSSRHMIAGDAGRFLLRFILLRGLSPAHVSGHYRVDERYRHLRPPDATLYSSLPPHGGWPPSSHGTSARLPPAAGGRRSLLGARRLSGRPPAFPARRQGDKVVIGCRGRLRSPDEALQHRPILGVVSWLRLLERLPPRRRGCMRSHESIELHSADF